MPKALLNPRVLSDRSEDFGKALSMPVNKNRANEKAGGESEAVKFAAGQAMEPYKLLVSAEHT